VTSIAIATEDVLTEVVCEKIAAYLGIEVSLRLRKGGSGYLKSKFDSFIQMSRRYPVLIVTDLDRKPCAPRLVEEWTQGRVLPEGLLLRVAVREVEAWLMADRQAFGALVGASIDFCAESVLDPKEKVLTLASRAARDVRDDLVASKGALASQGIGYNKRLCEFVLLNWCPMRASANSESLRRAMDRVRSVCCATNASG